jgi:hypothetical protein
MKGLVHFRKSGHSHLGEHDLYPLLSFVASFVLAVLAVLILTVSAK